MIEAERVNKKTEEVRGEVPAEAQEAYTKLRQEFEKIQNSVNTYSQSFRRNCG